MAWEGAFAITPRELDGFWVSPEFCIFEINEAVADSRYVAHLVAWEGLRDGLLERSSGTNARRRRLQPATFLKHCVPLPKLSTQKRIAAHLDIALHVSNRIVDANELVRKNLTNVVENAIQESVGAEKIPLRDLLERDRDWFEPVENRLYSPIGVRGFGRGIIRYAEIPRSELPKLRFYDLRPDRLLVSNIKAWEGAVAVTTAEEYGRVASNRFLQYRLTSHATSLQWIHAYLLSRAGIAKLQDASPGSADRNRTLSMDAFESIDIPIPSLSRQDATLGTLSKTASIESAGERRLALGNALLSATRNEVFSSLR